MSDIVWEDPPLLQRQNSPHADKWVRTLSPLVKHRKRWARIAEGPRSTMYMLASNLNTKRRHIPDGKWEFRARATDDPKLARVYARYLGPEDA